MWHLKKQINEWGETPEQEQERRLAAIEASITEGKLSQNTTDRRLTLIEYDLRNLRRAAMGLPALEDVHPDPDSEALFPEPYQPGSRDSQEAP